MGQSLASIIERRRDLALSGVWRRDDDLVSMLAQSDVLIDFSLPEANSTVVNAALERGVPLVCGVSGLDDQQVKVLGSAAAEIPVVFDRNMSVGIALLQRAIRDAAQALGDAAKVSVSEVHHIHKLDSPSGTAIKLAETIADARGESDTSFVQFDSERRGEVPGDHEVTLKTSTEILGFSHSVTTREVFAEGALKAACWLVRQKPGLYSMQDVLFGEKSRN